MRHENVQGLGQSHWFSRSSVGTTFSLLLCLQLVCSVEVFAQEATFTGTYRHREVAGERSRRYEAIDQATKDLGLLIRGRAREHLRQVTSPPQELTITDKGDQVTVETRGHRVTLTTDGSSRSVTGQNGSGTISALRQQRQFIITIRGKSGGRTTVYHLSDDDQRLTLTVEMNGEKLSKPIRYRAQYVRQ